MEKWLTVNRIVEVGCGCSQNGIHKKKFMIFDVTCKETITDYKSKKKNNSYAI